MKLKNNIRLNTKLLTDIIRTKKKATLKEICEKYLKECPAPEKMEKYVKDRISEHIKELFLNGTIISTGKSTEGSIYWTLWEEEEIDIGALSNDDKDEYVDGYLITSDVSSNKGSDKGGEEILFTEEIESKYKPREKGRQSKRKETRGKRKYDNVDIFVDMDNSPECLQELEKNILPKELTRKNCNVKGTHYTIRAYGNYHNGWPNKNSSEWFERVDEGITTYAQIVWELSRIVHERKTPDTRSLFVIASKNKSLSDFGPLVIKDSKVESDFYFVFSVRNLCEVFNE